MELDGQNPTEDALRQQEQHPNACRGLPERHHGAVHGEDMRAVTATALAKNVSKISKWYPDAETIYLAWDNWPNHMSKAVTEALAKQPRIRLLRLPTYSPWLNPIEKVWRWVRHRVTHAHPWCDNFKEFRT